LINRLRDLTGGFETRTIRFLNPIRRLEVKTHGDSVQVGLSSRIEGRFRQEIPPNKKRIEPFN